MLVITRDDRRSHRLKRSLLSSESGLHFRFKEHGGAAKWTNVDNHNDSSWGYLTISQQEVKIVRDRGGVPKAYTKFRYWNVVNQLRLKGRAG